MVRWWLAGGLAELADRENRHKANHKDRQESRRSGHGESTAKKENVMQQSVTYAGKLE